MKSRYCPFQELHGNRPAGNNENGFAKSSSIRYSTGGFKSHRRLDGDLSKMELDDMKLRNKLDLAPVRSCTSC